MKIFPGDYDAVAAQQDGAFIGDDFKQRFAARRIGDQLRFRVKRHAVAEDRALQWDGLKFALGAGEERGVGGVQVRYGKRIRARRVDGGVNRPLDWRTLFAFERFAAQI